jgi:hypothetical protein
MTDANSTNVTMGGALSVAGNVGIGTTNPIGGLHVKTSPVIWSANNYGASIVIDGARNNALGLFDSTSSNPWAIANVAGDINFAKMPALTDSTTSANPMITFKSSGNVGIGTITPGAKLDVAGTIKIADGTQ